MNPSIIRQSGQISIYPSRPHSSCQDIYYIVDIENKLYTLHQLATGRNFKIKIRTKTIKSYGNLIVGDIIKVLDIKQEGKWYKDEDDKWQQSTTNFEDVVNAFKKVEHNNN